MVVEGEGVWDLAWCEKQAEERKSARAAGIDRIDKFGPAEFPPSRELPVWGEEPDSAVRELFCR